MTPEQYREKWKLPRDYPMVSANHSASRSSIAKSFGLGRKKGVPVAKVRKSKVRA
jgi:predicted transcriptional regulator